MAKVNNPLLASVIRTEFGAQPNGDVWTQAKAVITPENEDDAAEVLAATPAFVKAAKASAKATETARKSRPAPEPGTVAHLIRTYEKKDKTATFTKKDGTVVACTPAQKAAWEKGRERFEVVNAERDAKVTQATPDVEALAKALIERPELVEALSGLLK